MLKRIVSCLLISANILTGQNVLAENFDEGIKEIENFSESYSDKDTSFIVKYKDGILNRNRANMLSDGGNISSNISVVTYDEEKSVDEVKRELDDSNIEYIQPNYMLELAATDFESEADTYEKVSESITGAIGSDSVTVGIIDSEIDSDNSQISKIISDNGYSWVDNSTLTEGELYFEQTHGTHIAGIIGGKSSVLQGESQNISIMPLTVFKGSQARTSDIIEAIEYAENKGVDIINMSFGCSEDNAALREAIERASDIMFVAAAGNFRRDIDEKPIYPAAYDLPNLISVTSVNSDGGLSYYSDYGENNVDIAALGKNIESVMPENERGKLSGTSMAAAVVSRGLALLYSNNKCNSPKEYKELLINSADKVSSLTGYVGNSAKLNAENALNGVTNTNVEEIEYEDEFSISEEVYDESKAYELFAKSKTVDIKSGMAHTLALKEDGSVWAWGDNTYGQLGNGTYKRSTYPIQVKGLTGIVKIEAGGYHNFARSADGKVYVWGKGDRGQLGSGTSNKNIPMEFYYKNCSFAAGLNHSVIAWLDWNVFVFGDNRKNQLGGVTDSLYLIPPTELIREGGYAEADVQSIGAAYNDSYYFTGAGSGEENLSNALWGFGYNIVELKMLGNGKPEPYFKEIVVGKQHAFIYTKDYDDHLGNGLNAETNLNQLWVYGANDFGQYGIDYNLGEPYSDCAYYTDELADYVQLAAGNDFTIGRKSDGTVYSWGVEFYAPEQLNNEDEYNPMKYSENHKKLPLSNIAAISAGDNFAIFVDTSGNIWGIGKNDKGQLGNGTTTDASTPVKTTEKEQAENKNVLKVENGYGTGIALKTDGTVWSWGNNNYGQLGIGGNENAEYPMKIEGLTNIIDIKIGYGFCLALKSDGTVWSWGKNDYGQLGNGSNANSNVPVQVQIDKNVKSISAGYEHAMLVTTDKLAYAWGRGNNYQLCNQSTTNKNVPTLISNLTYISDVSAGYNHSVILKQDGTVYTCGNNDSNKLGGNRSSNRHKLVAVMTDAKSIAAGFDNTLILSKNGIVYACGNNSYGKLGFDSDITPTDFTAVHGLENITEIFAGTNVNIAKASDEKCYVWGWKYDPDEGYDSPFYGYSLQDNNENVNILDVKDITDVYAGVNSMSFVKESMVYNVNEMGFFVPMAWNYTDDMPPQNGKGTKEEPYLIYNLSDFYKIENDTSAYYKLMADINANNEQISPISNFSGNFNGNNHSIYNLKIKSYDSGVTGYIGLFSVVNNKSVISGLNVTGAEIVGYTYAGVIAGYLNGGKIENCNVNNSSVKCINSAPGGIVGYNNGGTVINCTFSSKDMSDTAFTKTISVTKGKKYKYMITCNNNDDVSSYRYIVEYNADALTINTLGEDATNLTNGKNITNVSDIDGVLSFQINNSNKNWSGVLCPIEFTAKSTGNTTITVKVGNIA